MTILVVGVANERSLAWAIAKKLRQAGQQVVLSWQGAAQQQRIEKLTAGWQQGAIGHACDLSQENDIDNLAQWCKITCS